MKPILTNLKTSLTAFPLLVLLCFCLGFPVTASAQFTFSTNDGVVEIMSYSGTNTVVEIPATTGGYPITSIGNHAFSWKTDIKTVVIPSGITNIGDNAFGYCYSLAQVNIPEGTLRLGNSVFHDCTSLADIFIPQSVTNIGSTPFANCSSLPAINVAADNPAYASHQGVLLNKSLTTLIECPGGKTGDYVVPDGVTNLMEWAFFSCRRLNLISLPESVVDLGGVATFYNCSGLTNMVIPDKITLIPQSAFQYCTNLMSISLGTNVAGFGQDAFDHCTALVSLTMPNTVQSIGWRSFSYCTSLRTIQFGTNVSDIGHGAFEACHQLSSLWLPDSLRSIQSSAFATCSALGTVHFGSGLSLLAGDAFKDCHQLAGYEVNPQNTNYQSRAGVLFNRDFTKLLRYPLGLAGSYQVPAGVVEIGSEAFYDCPRLSGILVPDSVTSISYHAFDGCISLTSIKIPASVTNMQPYALAWCGTNLSSVFFAGDAPGWMDDSVFYGDTKATIYYLPGTSGWSSPFCGRPAVLWNPQPQMADASFGIHTNGFGFKITGSDGIPVVVEACTDLASPDWQPVSTNTLTGGAIQFSDPQWTNYPDRFYRLRAP